MWAATFALSPHETIEVVFAFVAAFGALLIWNLPRYRALAHYLVFQAVLMTFNLYEGRSTGFLVTPLFTLVKGPLLYLVIRELVNARRLRGLARYAHFLPPLVPLLLDMEAQEVVLLGSISQLVYLALAFHLLHRYNRSAQLFRSDADSLRLTWVSVAYWVIAAQAVIGLVRLNLQGVLDPQLLLNWFSLDLVALLGVCCFLLFKALRQPPLYDKLVLYEAVDQRGPAKDREGEAREARSVFARLDALVVVGQLYRKPRFSVEDLANETGMQMKDISWAFNIGGATSFNDYINRLRVEVLKRQLDLPAAADRSLLEMAFEAGFNSKSSFNSAFRREVGLTPSQYLKRSRTEIATRLEQCDLRGGLLNQNLPQRPV